MDDPDILGGKLKQSLAGLLTRGPLPFDEEEGRQLANLLAELQQRIEAMPPEHRLLLHAADSGFPSSGEWVDKTINEQDSQIKRLARAASMVADWLGPAVTEREKLFVIRGNIRGWAHRWRKADKGPAQVDSDADFVKFASECLAAAGVSDNPKKLIADALCTDWRTV